jgi:hypothetical protein
LTVSGTPAIPARPDLNRRPPRGGGSGSHRRLGALAGALLLLTGCAADRAPADPASLPVLALGDPVLEIGVLEGDDELVFGALESVLRLPDGGIAVSDGGATRISIFTSDGDFVRSWGSEGDGPGEFRSLSRIYPMGADSLMAAERFSGRLTVFDLEGEMGRLVAGSSLTGDSLFTLDSWLSGRFWIEGALTADARGEAREILDDLAVPPGWPGYRYVLVAEDGALWIREPDTDGDLRTWTRLRRDGPDAVVRIPVAFRPTHVRADEVLGVWSGESGVHFARVYVPTPTGETVPAPAWLESGRPTEAPPERPFTQDELMEEIISAVKNMASAQEIHYSGNMTYTTRIDSLDAFEQPETIHVDFLRADARGWAGVFSHSGVDRICALAYGFNSPPGWTPGRILCAPEPRAVEPGADPRR